MEYASVSITAQEFAQWTYAMYTSDTFRILAYPELYLFRYISTYSRIFRIAYWEFRSIPAYSAPFVTLAYSKPYHIPSQGVFRTSKYPLTWRVTSRSVLYLFIYVFIQNPVIFSILTTLETLRFPLS